MPFLFSIDRVADDLVRLRTLFANVYFLGTADGWVLIDGGLPKFSGKIIQSAESIFGPGARPSSILLTHGHFDHVGTLPDLIKQWDVPVYAHSAELPHLTGKADYPPPDPRVGKGLMALLSFAYPKKAIDLGTRVSALPAEGTVPDVPEWRWIHTPGHTRGHISLFRESDRLVITGDAFVTVQQESLSAVVRQRAEVHGPPAYFTPDWDDARRSVETLASLDPAIAATGHGPPMHGTSLKTGLRALVEQFDEIVVPNRGRYVSSHTRERDLTN